MSNLMLNLMDAENEVHRVVHGAFADAVIASLSAEPETLADLRNALGRFRDCREAVGLTDDWSTGISETPCDAGICFVDLPGRLVVSRSAYSSPRSHGAVQYHDTRSGAKVQLWFRLSDQWKLSDDLLGWRSLSKARRHQRRLSVTPEYRQVLYGKLARFLARECVAASRQPVGTSIGGTSADDEDRDSADILARIHEYWLLTPRSDLAGQTPRDVLLADQELIDFDLQSRRDQWNLLDACPPGLSIDSRAYQYAGFGTHEIVLYFELVRHLLANCWSRVANAGEVEVFSETRHLEELGKDWLDTISDDMLEGLTPASVIESERRRIPLAVSGGQAMVDCDCPLCQMMAESGPVFLHLDGCHMDEEFAFSFHRTRDQYEAERLEWESVEQEWDRELVGGQPSTDAQGPKHGQLWQRHQWDLAAAPCAETAPEFLLVAIAACLSELGLDLKESTESAQIVPALNRQFGNLREVARDRSNTLIQPVAERLVEELQEVLNCRPELTDKCTGLVTHLDNFVGLLEQRRKAER